MFWQYANAMGWVKLRVQPGDVPRASEIIAARQQTLGAMGNTEFVAEATATTDPDAAEESGAAPAAAALDPAADDEVEDPTDELAWRALRAAALGILFCPLSLYAAWLIGRLILSKTELSEAASRRMWLAFASTLAVLFAGGSILRLMFK
jgi:hypothetical protein